MALVGRMFMNKEHPAYFFVPKNKEDKELWHFLTAQ